MSTRGLSSTEVAARVARGEDNAWQPRVGRSYLDILRDNLFNIFNLVLFPLLGVIVHFREYMVALFAGFSVVSNAVLGTAQEMIAKRRLDRLVALSEHKVRVWRDGALGEVGIRELVVDDVLPLQPGERLVVDGRVLASDALELDESQLSGESDSVLKEVDDAVYSGSWCVAGTGLMVATAVGADSMINRIAQSARAWKHPLTPTQRKVMVIVDVAILLMLVLAPMLWLAGTLAGLDLLERVKESVVFITSLVPYGLLLVIMISLTIGALGIARHQTLVRRVNAVESLANATVLCFDKTGTLTENRLVVADILPLNGATPEEVRRQLRRYTANLAHHNGTAAAVAGHVLAALPPPTVEKLREIPFSSARQWGAVVLPQETLILGAPERLLEEDAAGLREEAQGLSARGLRVLTFARSVTPPQDGRLPVDAEPLALVTLSDSLRPDAAETLQNFREQNVALKVISGDHMETVRAIAGAAGMTPEPAWTGPQLENMDEAAFAGAAQRGSLFARVAPETKRRLVEALQAGGAHVAMVGDGVNDVPALKQADLAIVMNDGARIAREIGDILLLNNAMSTLPRAFAEGREITQTIYGTVRMFLTKTFYNVLLFVFVGFMALPFAITPVQINWVTFGTVNVIATLVAIKWLRPAFMANFRDDVFDYVVSGAFIGSVMMTLLYAATYFATGRDAAAARSALAIFATFFGILIFWNTFGIDFARPRTLWRQRAATVIGLAFTLLVILGFYAQPELFEFVRPDAGIIALITSILLLTIALLSLAMRQRGLLHRLWLLFGR
ncbi:MAG: HAD-IC family P-type ATPase [Anaerolineaceae bacterium]|nr:HAD-IC family P-type ATPase [Anaerolineaceae bacterium]